MLQSNVARTIVLPVAFQELHSLLKLFDVSEFLRQLNGLPEAVYQTFTVMCVQLHQVSLSQ